MVHTDLSIEAKNLLLKNGWHPDRKTNPVELTSYYRARGMDLNPFAISFLEEFMDIDFVKLPPKEDEMEIASFWVKQIFLASSRALLGISIERRVERIREKLNRNISFVGLMYEWQMDLFIDAEGNHFASEGFVYVMLGHDKYQMINNIVANQWLYSIEI